ncbi:MAG: putative oxygenase subunit protein, partial [Actinomycetia bacterium]|nr:putative oxygenase subunit protein [Actinomycetes bacterium]
PVCSFGQAYLRPDDWSARQDRVACPTGRFREAQAWLPSPIATNNAAHAAHTYFQAILERGDRPFDTAWMQETFDRCWAYAGPVTDFTNMMLGPLPEHVQQLLAAAAANSAIATRFADGCCDPTDFQHWFMDPERAAAYLASVSGQSRP